MPRPPRTRERVTLYRLTKPSDLRVLIRAKYLDQLAFSADDVVVAGVPGLLVSGQIPAEKVRWADSVATYTG